MTNGYNTTVVLPAMERIGWLQPTTKGYDLVDCDNTQSESGRYYNDGSFHASLLIENLYDCQPDADITEDDFNAYLVQLRRSVILSALNAVFDAPQYVASGILFRKAVNTVHNPVVNNGNFCGIRIKVSDGDYGVMLKNAILFFNADVSFPLYLYHSLTNGTDTIDNVPTDVPYIKKWQVAAKGNSQTTVALSYALGNATDVVKGGEWFLGYFQNDLGAVRAYDYSVAANCYHVFGGVSFESKANGADFDRESYGCSAGMYGLNAELSSYRDMTETIVNNAQLFDNLQGLMMAARAIEIVQNSARANARERMGKENLAVLYRDLNQVTTADNPYTTGLKGQILQEVKRLRDAFYKRSYSITINNPAI